MKVKMLYSSHITNLETNINCWLDSNCKAEVIDIKYAVSDHNAGMFKYSAMIIYK